MTAGTSGTLYTQARDVFLNPTALVDPSTYSPWLNQQNDPSLLSLTLSFAGAFLAPRVEQLNVVQDPGQAAWRVTLYTQGSYNYTISLGSRQVRFLQVQLATGLGRSTERIAVRPASSGWLWRHRGSTSAPMQQREFGTCAERARSWSIPRLLRVARLLQQQDTMDRGLSASYCIRAFRRWNSNPFRPCTSK